MNNFANVASFLSYCGFTFALAQLSKWVVKEHHTKSRNFSLQNLFHIHCILTVAALIFTISTTYTTPFLYAYLLYATLIALTIFTDLYAMLIAPMFTIYCAPLAWTAAGLEYIPLTLTQSLTATLIALLVGRILYYLFFKLMQQEAIGAGDLDLLIFVAAWTGLEGFLLTLSLGSYLATMYGVGYWIIYRTKHFKLPFGTFLGIASLTSLALPNLITPLKTAFIATGC